MQYVGYALYALSALFTLIRVVGLRFDTVRGTPPTSLFVVRTMLFAVSLAIIPLAELSPLHLLWMMPASSIVGLLSNEVSFLFLLLAIPAGVLYRIACLGIDFEAAERNRIRVLKMKDLIEAGFSPEQARNLLKSAGEW